MRLLNTRTLTLEEFGGGGDDDVPPYSILSHRWGHKEISFQDIQSRPGTRLKGLKGFRKLKEFCALSREEGYKYGWMDTCCIDKSSSAELSEAINSMFRWYQDASICYAYLGDVRDSPGTDPGSSASSFRDSQWFTRGWTLQELIAPDSVVFLNANWREMGTRTTLGPLLHSITGIHSELFKPSIRRSGGVSVLLRRYSIAQKISWASRRTTTRVEDQAYCLMGLLDVSMPLLYGEGSKAFLRLQQLVINQSADASIFVWHSPTAFRGLVTGILADSPRCFVHAQNVERILPPRPDPWGVSSFFHHYQISNNNVIMDVPILEEQPAGGSPDDEDVLPGQEKVVFAVLDCRDAETGRDIVLPLLDFAPSGSRALYRYQVGKTLYYSGEPSRPMQRRTIGASMETDSRFLDYSRGNIGDLAPRSLNLVNFRLNILAGGYNVRQAGGKGWIWSCNDESMKNSRASANVLEAAFGMGDSTPGWITFAHRYTELLTGYPLFAFACHPQPGGHMRFGLRTLGGNGGEFDVAAAGWDMYHSEEHSEMRLLLPDFREAVVRARIGAASCNFLILVRRRARVG